MYPAPFEYYRPSTLSEAVTLLARHGDRAKLIAGGHSLLPAMKLRLAQPEALIDIGRIAELNYIREDAGSIAIGAATTHGVIEVSSLLQARSPLLPDVAAHIGDVQVRNKGTIGGSLIHADPAADWPAAVLALDAELQLAGASGLRTVRAADFFVGVLQTAIAPGEILCEIRVPATPKSVAYVKTEQKASGFALCGVAVVLNGDRVSIGVTGVTAIPYHVDDPTRVTDGIDPLSDIHASAEFRAHLARVNTRKALELARSRG